jgi:hypothetical protein
MGTSPTMSTVLLFQLAPSNPPLQSEHHHPIRAPAASNRAQLRTRPGLAGVAGEHPRIPPSNTSEHLRGPLRPNTFPDREKTSLRTPTPLPPWSTPDAPALPHANLTPPTHKSIVHSIVGVPTEEPMASARWLVGPSARSLSGPASARWSGASTV